MSRTVSENQAISDIGELIAWAKSNNESILLEDGGMVTLAIVPAEGLNALEKLRELVGRGDALLNLRALRADVNSMDPSLSEEDALALAEDITREAVSGMKPQIRN